MLIGGIEYSDSVSDGRVDGFCCESCISQAYVELRDGTASVAVGDDMTVYRFRILKHVHQLSAPMVPGSWRRFMLTGLFQDRTEPGSVSLIDQLGYTHTHQTGSPDYKLRMAMAYLNEKRTRPDNSDYTVTLESYLSAVERFATPASFTCRDCSETITDADAIQSSVFVHIDSSISRDSSAQPNVCGGCFSHYTECVHLGIWAPPDMETVEALGIPGYVTLEWAQSHLRWVESEDEDADEGDGYWTNERNGRSRGGALLEYNANPFDHFAWDARNKPNALVFGVELEMEPARPTDTGQRRIIEVLGGSVGKNFLLKSDGSLNYGVELVTMPFTLAQHLDGSGVPWEKLLTSVKDIARSGAGTSACGIHIHINKKALSALTIGKMLVFLNNPSLGSLVTTIAQRASGSYCNRSAKKLTSGKYSSEDRYDIMNVSVRHPTCEIRMFRGNITLERVYKNIEFCHALIQYCRQASMRTLTDWGNFSGWLIAHRGQYQNLVRFLIDMNTVGFRQLARVTRDGTVTIEDR